MNKSVIKIPRQLDIYVNCDDCFDITNGLNFECKIDELVINQFYNLEFNFINPYCDDNSYKSSEKDWINLFLLWDSDIVIGFPTNTQDYYLRLSIFKYREYKALKYKDLFDKKNNQFFYNAYLNNCGRFILFPDELNRLRQGLRQ